MKKVVLLLCTVFSCQLLSATLTGNITFVKKPPFTGVLYANGGSGPSSAELDQSNKVFDKKLLVVGEGGNLKFKNSDSFQHNIFANDPNTNVKFDVGLMEQGQTKEIKADWKSGSVTRIGCKIHPKMRSYIANVPSDKFQVFEFEKKVKEYSVKLDVGSASTFTLSIPKYDDVVVSLSQGESKSVDIMYKGKKKATMTLSLD